MTPEEYEIALVALAAWNNIPLDKLPTHPTMAQADGPSMQAWLRVVRAIREPERARCAAIAKKMRGHRLTDSLDYAIACDDIFVAIESGEQP